MVRRTHANSYELVETTIDSPLHDCDAGEIENIYNDTKTYSKRYTMDDESPSGNTREMKDTKKGGKGIYSFVSKLEE